MINAWSLAYEELNGTMDKTYPIKKEGRMTDKITLGAGTTESVSGTAESISINTDEISNFTVDSSTLNFGTPIPGGMGEDHIKLTTGYSGTAYDDPKYYSVAPEYLSPDSVNLNFDGLVDGSKPEPDLNYKSQKYQEDKGIADLKDYVSSTYRGHYTNKNSDTQTLDLIHSVGDAEAFCRSNALKYLSRYDKKGSAKQDILKAMHYCLLLYYFSGNTQEPDYTNTRYETF